MSTTLQTNELTLRTSIIQKINLIFNDEEYTFEAFILMKGNHILKKFVLYEGVPQRRNDTSVNFKKNSNCLSLNQLGVNLQMSPLSMTMSTILLIIKTSSMLSLKQLIIHLLLQSVQRFKPMIAIELLTAKMLKVFFSAINAENR